MQGLERLGKLIVYQIKIKKLYKKGTELLITFYIDSPVIYGYLIDL